MNKNIRTITDDARQVFLASHWPANVRELENVIERAVAVSIGEKITRCDLPSHLQKTKNTHTAKNIIHPGQSLKKLEAAHIRELLDKEDMNYAKVAEVLGISRTTLWRKMKEYDIAKS